MLCGNLGGSGRIEEISETVVDREKFSEELQAIKRKPGDPMSVLDYRLAWARNYLKNIGCVENSVRGVWALTEEGRKVTADVIPGRVREWKRVYYQQRKAQAETEEAAVDEDEVQEEERDWKSELLERLLELPPEAFERLAQAAAARGRVPQR